MLSLAQFGNIGAVIGGVFVILMVPFALRARGAARLFLGLLTALVGWAVARAIVFYGAPIVSAAVAQERGAWADWLMQPSAVDVMIFGLFMGLALLFVFLMSGKGAAE